MPRTNINYSNTIIYKLCCNDLSITDIYIGQTTDFRKRKNRHKFCCNNETAKGYDYNVYAFIRDNGGWDNWDMIEIERYEAIDGNDAKKRERYWIEEFKASLNCKLPTRTNKEYIEHHKEHLDECKKIYRETHKEEKAITDKEYYEKNKEKILEKNKEYVEKNKEYLKLHYREKIECECGCIFQRCELARHKKSKKHIYIMSNYDSKSSMTHLTSACDVETRVI